MWWLFCFWLLLFGAALVCAGVLVCVWVYGLTFVAEYRQMDSLTVKVREYENILKDMEHVVDGRMSERIKDALDKVGLVDVAIIGRRWLTQHSLRQYLPVLNVLPWIHQAARPFRTMSQSTPMILLRLRRLARWKQ